MWYIVDVTRKQTHKYVTVRDACSVTISSLHNWLVLNFWTSEFIALEIGKEGIDYIDNDKTGLNIIASSTRKYLPWYMCSDER